MHRAIETNYKGYKFRSRIEARWAVFFDELRIDFEYEPQGFDLDDLGYYLPAFYLPKVRGGLWVEIRSAKPTEREIDRLRAVVCLTGKLATFRVGEPMKNAQVANGGFHSQSDLNEYCNQAAVIFSDGLDTHHLFCLCPSCLKVGFEYCGKGDRVCTGDCSANKKTAVSYNETAGHPLIVYAAHAARGAEFESWGW